MAEYQILYWCDIPAQLKAFEGKKPISRPLPDRFQVEIDRVAMKDGLYGTDDYLDQWQWSGKQEREGSAEEVLETVAAELEAKFNQF